MVTDLRRRIADLEQRLQSGLAEHEQVIVQQDATALDNARLLTELRAAQDRQTGSAEILRAIANASGEAERSLHQIAETTARLFDAPSVTLHIAEGDDWGPTIRVGDSSKRIGMEVSAAQLRIGGHNLPGTVLLQNRQIHIPDINNVDPQFADWPGLPPARAAGTHAIAGTPLRREDKAIGVLIVYRDRPLPFTADELALQQSFADQAVIAIENARLFNEVQARTGDLSEALQQQTATAEVLKVISRSAFDLQKVLDTLSESAARLCEADIVVIHRSIGDSFQGAASFGLPEDHHRAVMDIAHKPGRGSLGARVLFENAPVLIDDAECDPEYTFGSFQRRIGMRSMLGVPLMREGAAIGLLLIFRKRVQPFTKRHVDLATTFADQAVIAIENVRLFDEVQARTEDLRESLQFQTATSDVLKVISSSPDSLQPVLDVIVDTSRHLCGTETSTIFLLRDQKFHIAAASGAMPEYLEFLQANPIALDQAGSSTSRAAREKRTVHIPDIGADPEFGQGPMAVGQRRALLSVPLMHEDTAIGVITMRQSHLTPFTERQIEVVKTFADQAVIALSNVRLFEEVQVKTRDLTESLQQQTATADVLKVISRSAFDLQTVLDTLVESAARLCEADMAAITRQHGDEYFRAGSYGFASQFMDYVRDIPVKPERGTITGRTLLEGKVIHVPDVHADPDYTFSEAQRLSGDPRTFLGVPLLRKGHPAGALLLLRRNMRPFTDKQIELVKTFADQAVIAIENVRLFDEVQARTKELAASLDDLRTAQDRLIQTEKLASLGQLTAGIAHEIKNPLNFVNNFAALSAELIDELNDLFKPAAFDGNTRKEVDELTQTLKDNLEKIVQHGKRADSIVKNMLLHSREGSGEHRPSDINALLDESLNLAYHGARAEKPQFNVTLQRDFDASAGEIELFPQEITRVFLNLISNGFYAVSKRRAENGNSGFEPVLSATTRNLGETVEIRIRDNGTGIPTEVKEKMFNPFFTTKPAGEGTGLGLSMSHDIIVKQHGGRIDVDTEPGQFTEFRIILPRTSNFSNKNRG
ncbi:MAG TPA: GAF domain-containing protein [Bradyrhizobium sp.]|nr:GAF domain-containing protein [Bradyrhizobium sp.]